MKRILILLAMIFFIGCKMEETTMDEKVLNPNGWYLEYSHKVKIQNEDFYECVYGRHVGYRRGLVFVILSNTTCKEKL